MLAQVEMPASLGLTNTELIQNDIDHSSKLFATVIKLKSQQKILREELTSLKSQIEKLRKAEAISADELDLDEEDYALAIAETEEVSFDDMEHSFSFEDDDPAWQAEMQDSIDQIKVLLSQLQVDSIEVANHECRSESCIVEYNFSDPETMYKIRPILNADGASKSTFKETEIDGQKKMIAIYKR